MMDVRIGLRYQGSPGAALLLIKAKRSAAYPARMKHEGFRLPAEWKDYFRPILDGALMTCRAFHNGEKPLIQGLHRCLRPQ
jgi:hypothetical protein